MGAAVVIVFGESMGIVSLLGDERHAQRESGQEPYEPATSAGV
jgi:hypothetical protein